MKNLGKGDDIGEEVTKDEIVKVGGQWCTLAANIALTSNVPRNV